MDLYIGLMKCEPEEIIVKSEPLSLTEEKLEHSFITVNNEIVKTECESVSCSSGSYGSVNDDMLKQERKPCSCIEKQLATLPKRNQHSQVDGLSAIKHAFKEESETSDKDCYGQENGDNLMNTKDAASCTQTRKPKTLMKTLHSCPYCNRNFDTRGSFTIHLWKRHSKKTPDFLLEKFNKKCFTCDICKFKSSCALSFKSHMLRHETHMQEKHSCRFCNKTLCNSTSLADHLLVRHSDNVDKSLKTIFSRTIKNCHLCDFRAVRKSLLDKHMHQKHSNDKPTHTCRFCNKTFIIKICFVDHLLSHHGDKFEKSLEKLLSLTIKHCNLCDYRICCKDKLAEHIQREHFYDRATYTCRLCNKPLFQKTSLASHLLRQHSDQFDKSLKSLLSHTIIYCKFCDFRTIKRSTLTRHVTNCHSFVKEITFKCKSCDYESSRKWSLQVHIQRKHSNARPTYSCRFCNKMLFNKMSLADHLLCHHDDKFDQSLKTLLSMTIKHCKFCDFRTVVQVKLNEHVTTKHRDSQTDTDPLIFKCNNCDYETFKRRNIKLHIKNKHSNDRPCKANDRPTYACRLCNKTFLNKRSLACHLLHQHGEKFDKSLKTLLSLNITHCELCDFRTITKWQLNQHMKQHDDIPVWGI